MYLIKYIIRMTKIVSTGGLRANRFDENGILNRMKMK